MSEFPTNRELVLDRLIDAPRRAVFRCWTEAELIKQWFAPAPYTVVAADLNPRPGGANSVTMRSGEGQEVPSDGVYLEVVTDERIVFTDAFSAGFQPREGAPFMVATIELSDEDGKTRYIARARHWSEETAKQHESMGFHDGWNTCADQLEAVAKKL